MFIFHDNGSFISVFDAFSFCREISHFILHSQMHTIIFTCFFPVLLLIRKLLLTLRSGRFPHFLLDLWVVCVALIFNIKIVNSSAKSCQSCSTLRSHGLKPTRLLCPWDSPGKNTGVDCHPLLQGLLWLKEKTCVFCPLHWQALN